MLEMKKAVKFVAISEHLNYNLRFTVQQFLISLNPHSLRQGTVWLSRRRSSQQAFLELY